jgi:hypothetical protein
MARRRCRNCPKLPTEVETLWQANLARCSDAMDTMARCIVMGVPGDPLPQMRKLVARLNTIIQTCENNHASTDSVE